MFKKALILFVLFAIGLASGSIATVYLINSPYQFQEISEFPDDSQILNQDNQRIFLNNFIEQRDKPSPQERVVQDNITVYRDEVILKIDNPQWAIFTDTKSMDPVIDSSSKAIQVIPESEKDIKVGDIVAYKSEYKDGTIAHRVHEIGYDKEGWFARMKGDNNNYIDPGKVRFSQIKRVVVAVIY